EVNAQGVILAVTHWVPRSFRQAVVGNAGFSGEEAQTPCRNDRAIWEIRGRATRCARRAEAPRLQQRFARPRAERRGAAASGRPRAIRGCFFFPGSSNGRV